MMTTPAVTISARRDSRWRCGVEHTHRAVPWPAGSWSEEQLEMLLADPMLVVIAHDHEEAADPPPTLTTAQIAWLRSLTPTQLERLAGFDRDWIDRLIAVANLRAEQIDRLVDMESDGVQALLFPSTPTVEAALAMALEASQRATPDELRAFHRALGVEAKPEDAIAGACAVLKIGRDPASWTKDGKPQVSALEAVLGFDATAAQRDAAWAELEPPAGEGQN